MIDSPKILISGGGTGGHIYPAVAIANEIKSHFPNSQILFVGAQGKMEMEKVPKAGFDIIGLPIAGINRSNMMANISFPIKFFRSIFKAFGVVKDFKPDLAIGVGGYASGPTLLMANLQGVPTLIQEQNSYAGLTNKFLSKRAKKICVAYPSMEQFFPEDKIAFTGNPVRQDLVEMDMDQSKAKKHFDLDLHKKTLLVIGGSQGARSINIAIAEGLKTIDSAGIQLIWQTGKGFIEEAKKIAAETGFKSGYIADFIYEMKEAYAAADIVVSRAGALSVSELCLTGKPAILVPFPNAAEDHQTKNAMSLVNNQAALLVKDSEVKSDLVAKAIELMNAEKLQKELSENIKKLARPTAAKLIVEEVEKILKTNK